MNGQITKLIMIISSTFLVLVGFAQAERSVSGVTGVMAQFGQ